MSAALRRLPLRQAIESLRNGEGSTPLSSAVSGIAFNFVAKNSEAGPREFLRTIAPRIAYSNPTLPIRFDRIRDPRSKSIDPKSPDAGAQWEGSEQPGPSMVVAFHGRPTQTVPLRHLSAEQIWKQLESVAGEQSSRAIEAPRLESGQDDNAERSAASALP